MDLSVDFAGLHLNTPLVVASGPPGATLDRIKLAEQCGAGAVITKMILFNVPPRSISRFYMTEKIATKTMLFASMDKRLNVQEGIELIKAAKAETRIPIIANIMGPGEDVEGWVKLGKIAQEAGADGIELDLSCPNVSHMAKLMKAESGIKELGAVVGQDPSMTYKIVKALVEEVKIPIIPKLTPEVTDITIVGGACLKAGAQLVSAINGASCLPGADIYNGGRPPHPGMKTQAFGGLCGAPLRYLAYKHVAHLSLAFPGMTILGGGGLTDWKSTVEMIMFGATATTYCSILMMQGFEVLSRINRGLKRYMQKMGYESLRDFRGAALAHLKASEQAEVNDLVAGFIEEKCNKCGLCFPLCHCEAITEGPDGSVLLDPSKCTGCGVCYRICPQDAFLMEPAKA